MFPVIVCIAKKEKDYIEEFINYHLKLGFKYIYLYDNEDVPTYEIFLNNYKDYIKVIHLPFNNYNVGVQYIALNHFINNFLDNELITHVAHIDIDEFIVLKKHNNICDFIKEYIVEDCEGIGMNWRYFGSSNKEEKSYEPVTLRFTMCAKDGDRHIKTLFKKNSFLSYNTCHDVNLKNGHIKSTNGTIIIGPWNNNIDLSVIQLNHYKVKTFPEFKETRMRGYADLKDPVYENVEENFRKWDLNEIDDLYAHDFYLKIKDN